jgi:hypothetical protein
MTTQPYKAPPGFDPKRFADLPRTERALAWAAYLADVARVREVGNNRGPWVDRILYEGTQLGPGNAWCAAFVSFCLRNAGFREFRSARVSAWADWSIRRQLAVSLEGLRRGDLVYWIHANGTGHIEIVTTPSGQRLGAPVQHLPVGAVVPSGYVATIGGNTSAGNAGSQREGDGVYRRLRPLSMFSMGIRWDG